MFYLAFDFQGFSRFSNLHKLKQICTNLHEFSLFSTKMQNEMQNKRAF